MPLDFIAYQQGQPLAIPTLDDISDILEQTEGFVLFTTRDPSSEELRKLQEEFALHELAIEDASHAHQRPKLEVYGDSLFMVLHTAWLEPGEHPTCYGELHVFIGRQFLIVIQHGEAGHFLRLRQKLADVLAAAHDGPGRVLHALLDFMVDEFLLVADEYQCKLEKLEDDIFDNRVDSLLIEHIYELKRSVTRLHNLAVPVGDICSALSRLHRHYVPKPLAPYFRDVQDHVLQVVRSMDVMRESLTDAMQVNLALVSMRQNEVVKRLAGWGAILALPTMVFSLYGMNFRNMPELEMPYGYPVALGFTLIGCLIIYRRLRASCWL